MNNQLENSCAVCGKPQKKEIPGSMTQWIFSSEFCSCHLNLATENETDSIRCPDCGLTISSSQSGSMTQWIFGRQSCKCNVSKPLESLAAETSTDSATALNEELEEEEEELEVERQAFPIERYKPLSILGKGSIGIVYLARDRLLGKKLTVKVLRQLNEEQMLSFQAEAKATSKLSHPSILTVYDFGPAKDGTPYMVSEYIQGISFKQYLRVKGKVNFQEFSALFEQIIDALVTAHDAGVYHRDLKPDNVIISYEQDHRVKLIDFGVAQMKVDADTPLVINSNTLVGTPPYMAPDVAQGLPYDQRSEVYSVGCMMFEALTGKPPFMGETSLDTLRMHAEDPVPSLKSRGSQEDNSSIQHLIQKCLAKDPEHRYQSMKDLHHELDLLEIDSISENETQNTEADRSVQKSLKPLILSTVLIGLTCFGAIALWMSGQYWEQSKSKSKTTEPSISKAKEKELAVMEKAYRSIGELKASAKSGKAEDQLDLGLIYKHGAQGQKVDYKKALYWIKKAAQSGLADAQVELGLLYIMGEGARRNDKLGRVWLKKAVAQNNARAMYELGNTYYWAEGVGENNNAALIWYRKAAALGHAESIMSIGSMYHHGMVVKKDFKLARKYYREAIAKGSAEAYYHLGTMYAEGDGTKVDYKRALMLLKKSFALGYGEPAVYIGKMYSTGRGVKKDISKSLDWYRKAAEKDNPRACHAIAVIYYNGNHIPKDYTEALKWYKKSAAYGSGSSMTQIGEMYQTGKGVSKDYQKAMQFYKMGVKHGSATAYNQIGVLYRDGLGVKRDHFIAANSFKKGMKEGSDLAAINYAKQLMVGKGVTKNGKRAVSILKSTAKSGCGQASFMVAELYQQGKYLNKNQKRAKTWYKLALKQGYSKSKEKSKKKTEPRQNNQSN